MMGVSLLSGHSGLVCLGPPLQMPAGVLYPALACPLWGRHSAHTPGQVPPSPQHPSRRLTLLPGAPGFLLPVVLQTPHTPGPCRLLPVCQMTAWGSEEQPVTYAADSGLWAGGARVLSGGHQAHWVGRRVLWLAQAGAGGSRRSHLSCSAAPPLALGGMERPVFALWHSAQVASGWEPTCALSGRGRVGVRGCPSGCPRTSQRPVSWEVALSVYCPGARGAPPHASEAQMATGG